MRKFALIVALFVGGCGSVSASYVKADRATYEAIVPEYVAYLNSDSKLTKDDKEIKLRTVETWKVRIDHFQKSLDEGK